MSSDIDDSEFPNEPVQRAVLRALTDLDRLRIVLAISEAGMSVQMICQEVAMGADVVGNHLQVLGKAGMLVTERTGRERIYRINKRVLSDIQSELASNDQPVRAAGMTTVAARFFAGDRLVSFPSSVSKQREVLGVLVHDFAAGQEYGEREVNEILVRRHPDCATLRRALVDEGFMTRTAGIYRRIQSG